jgi:S-adenosylmethionine uptake transporter
MFLGCVLDAIIKHLGASYSAIAVACGRFCFGASFAGIAMIAMKRSWPGWRTLRGHALRAIASTIAVVLFFHSLQILPIAEATVLMFCAPLMVAPLARWILGEKLKHWAVIAILVGFVGVIVTVQGAPLVSDDTRRLEGVAAGLTAAVLYALSIVLLRQLAQRDDTLTTAFLGNLFPALYLVPPALILGFPLIPADVPAFAATGLVGFSLWLLLTVAYSRAPAQRLAPAEYSSLIWAAALGYIFFQEVPRWQIYAGGVVICLAVAVAAWDGQREARLVAPPMPKD